jgi:hypothetical protein
LRNGVIAQLIPRYEITNYAIYINPSRSRPKLISGIRAKIAPENANADNADRSTLIDFARKNRRCRKTGKRIRYGKPRCFRTSRIVETCARAETLSSTHFAIGTAILTARLRLRERLERATRT